MHYIPYQIILEYIFNSMISNSLIIVYYYIVTTGAHHKWRGAIDCHCYCLPASRLMHRVETIFFQLILSAAASAWLCLHWSPITLPSLSLSSVLRRVSFGLPYPSYVFQLYFILSVALESLCHSSSVHGHNIPIFYSL